MSRKGNLIKNWEELSVTHLKPGQGSDEKADCEIAEKDDGHLAVQVISQAFLESVGGQRHDKEHNAEKEKWDPNNRGSVCTPDDDCYWVEVIGEFCAPVVWI